MRTDPVTLFLCGDVMLGRGVDQILPYPGDPTLQEQHVLDARTYVDLAEAANGLIPQPVDFSWPWGDALRVLEEGAPDVRVVNLETSITRSDDFAMGKAVHYRMNPDNLPCLAVARPDVCVLANNHVMDFGRRGLRETLGVLAGARLRAAGAGREADEARRPATVTVAGGGQVLILSCGTESSGIPPEWAATPDRGGVDLVPELSEAAAAEVAGRVRQVKRPGDVAVISIHWGSNWGYQVSREQRRFAHRLVDGGVDVVHGHSSHHPRPVEVYRGRLILYGCGDLIDDYEGITGYEEYRDDLRLLYFVSVEPESGKLAGLRMVPMRARQMRLQHASSEDSEWLQAVLDRVGRDLGSRVDLEPDGALALRRT
ncbi:CapA family protein [Streptosporangium sp. NBC_01755]|uniref:CapA family protein n=1 Tax=Streptosporangium sp. NBC_01755 TaxID=2975949 RepID=UPI002DDC7639|nr:CapA family protein [Streptosporangium sp. NBC_01755]WSC98706.1 CapA family protein [Streptosporangium sp. NBC_01755]